MCQLKFDNSGKLTIKGTSKTIAIDPNTSSIGSSFPILYFNYNNNFRMVCAKLYLTSSNSTLIENILPLEKVMTILKQLNAYSYYFKSDIGEDRQREFGVLAEEVETVLPSLVITSDDNKFINYDGFIPLLIEAVKEQQNEIEMLQKIVSAQERDLIELQTLRKEFKELQKIVYKLGGISEMNVEEQPLSPKKAVLLQNNPNPFSSNTEIVCNLPETTKQAAVYIYNLQGVELKSYPLSKAGLNAITIYGSELPAGIYLYSLVVDNVIADTKRMILTK